MAFYFARRAFAEHVASSRSPRADWRAFGPHCFVATGHEVLNECHLFGTFAAQIVALAVFIMNEIAFTHGDRRFVRIRSTAAREHVHEMLGAFVVMVRGLRAGRVDDHLALDRVSSEELRRCNVYALACIVL